VTGGNCPKSSAKRAQALIVASAAASFGLGLLCTPENLLRLEIMETSLNAENALIRDGARLEIAVARWVGFIVGAVLLLLAPFWPGIEDSARYRAFLDREREVLPEQQRLRHRFLTPSLAVMTAAIGAMLLWIATADTFLTFEQQRVVHREDGIFQTASALFLLCAAAISVRIALRVGPGRPDYYMHLFLGLLFFVMFGEEISWGQRYFGLVTPEFIAAVNAQGEINFHNMYGYFFDHLFILFFLLWGVAVSLLDRFSVFFRQVFSAIGLPVPSAGLAVAMLVISLMQSVIVYELIDPLPTLRLPEVRELLSALAFVVLMMECWVVVARQVPARPSESAAGAGGSTPSGDRRS
jgi:cytochrome b